MKKAISYWSFAGSDVFENLRLAKEAGFEAVELTLDAEGPVTMESTKEDILKIKAYGESLGLSFQSVAASLYWAYNYTSENPENREKAKAVTKKQLEIASWLGCDTILVVPGAVYVPWEPGEIVEYDVAYDRALDAVRELAPIAEEYKIYIGIENVWNHFLLSPLEMRDFIDKVGSEYVGAYFDVGNVLNVGFPDHWIKILGSRIKKVHIKDSTVADATSASYEKNLLEGEVDWPGVIEALKKIGYDDVITAEILPPYTHYPEALIYNTSLSMDYILGRK